MSEFKVGDLISEPDHPASLYKIVEVDEDKSRYYVETILDWRGSPGPHESMVGAYLLFEESRLPTFETMLRYEKLKREVLCDRTTTII